MPPLMYEKITRTVNSAPTCCSATMQRSYHEQQSPFTRSLCGFPARNGLPAQDVPYSTMEQELTKSRRALNPASLGDQSGRVEPPTRGRILQRAGFITQSLLK